MKLRERWVASLASVSVPSVPPEFSEKPEKTQSPERSTASCSASDEEFNSILGEAQSRLVSSVQQFAKVIYHAGASTRITWR